MATLVLDASGNIKTIRQAAPAHALLDGIQNNDTAASSPVRGGLIAANATPAWAQLAIGSANRVLRSDGGDPSWAQVVLTTDVTGVLPLANGGTGTGGTATRDAWISAAMGLAGGGSLATIGGGTDATPIIVCSDGATNGGLFMWNVPSNWLSGVVTIQPIWVPGATDAVAHTVRWQFTVREVSAGVDDTSGGTVTAWTGASAARTVNLAVYDTATSSGVTPTAIGNLFKINVHRLGGDAADTYVGTVNLVGIRLTYTATS